MVLWQGLTEGGTAVPVQVTEAGKVVAEGQQGQEGPPGPPGEQGPQGPQGEYGPGDDVDLGSITASLLDLGDKTNTSGGATYYSDGRAYWRNDDSTTNVLRVFSGGYGNEFETFGVSKDGAITTAGNVKVQATGDDNFTALSGRTLYGYSGPRTADIKYTLDAQTGNAIFQGTVTAAGSSFAENKCGFTEAGEIYFTSRGTRYKIEVAGGLCNPVEFTREMELRERLEEKRNPRTTDSVPED